MSAKKTYLRFRQLEQRLDRKTPVYVVESISQGSALGHIGWYGSWRQFVFEPHGRLLPVFSAGCLNEISEFIDGLADLRRHRRAEVLGAVS